MPINYEQIQAKLQDYASKVKLKLDDQARSKAELWQKLQARSNDIEAIKRTVEAALLQPGQVYCAKPLTEALLFHKGPSALPETYTLIAADGSQIAPNRHKAVEYCVINVGLIAAEIGSGKAPQTAIESRLLDFEQLTNEDGFLIGEQQISRERDLAERQALLGFAAGRPKPIICMTDGLLDIQLRLEKPETQAKIQEEMRSLHRQLQAQEIISLGYIDRPGSDLISRLFELLDEQENGRWAAEPGMRKGRSVSDAALFRDLLQNPGERSAVFEVVRKTPKDDSANLQVHFFLLNVGEVGEPSLARVEFPAWVSQKPGMVDLLHAAIYADAQATQGHPYPYMLLRAHELAIIKFSEHEEIETMLLSQLGEEGLPLGQISNKQHGKDQVGRRDHG